MKSVRKLDQFVMFVILFLLFLAAGTPGGDMNMNMMRSAWKKSSAESLEHDG